MEIFIDTLSLLIRNMLSMWEDTQHGGNYIIKELNNMIEQYHTKYSYDDEIEDKPYRCSGMMENQQITIENSSVPSQIFKTKNAKIKV
jgi:hypothetical protein